MHVSWRNVNVKRLLAIKLVQDLIQLTDEIQALVSRFLFGWNLNLLTYTVSSIFPVQFNE
jgi:hypothetical protein